MDRFDQAFSNATGNDNFPLAYGSKGARVKSLQQSLILLGASVPSGPTGNFFNETQNALKKLNYPSSINEQKFMEIMARASASAGVGTPEGAGTGTGAGTQTTVLSESQLRALWRQSKTKFGALSEEPDYEKWKKREAQLSKWKEIGKGLFQVSTNYYQSKQNNGGDGNIPYYDQQMYDSGKIYGMPKGVVYFGGFVLGGLLILGVATIVKNMKTAKIANATPPVTVVTT